MSEAPRIQLERSRPVCPFCKGEVGGGHVWVCPACEAPHHADCHEEHPACATCGSEVRGEPEVAAAAPRADASSTLAGLRALAERLGFAVVREAADQVFAVHLSYEAVFRGGFRAHALQVVAVDHLTRGQVEADLRRLASDPLARCDATLLYLADQVDLDADVWLRSPAAAQPAAAGPPDASHVPMARTPQEVVKPPPEFLGPRWPTHEGLVQKLLAGLRAPVAPVAPVAARPRATPTSRREAPLSLDGLQTIALAVAIAMLVALLVLTVAFLAA